VAATTSVPWLLHRGGALKDSLWQFAIPAHSRTLNISGVTTLRNYTSFHETLSSNSICCAVNSLALAADGK